MSGFRDERLKLSLTFYVRTIQFLNNAMLTDYMNS